MAQRRVSFVPQARSFVQGRKRAQSLLERTALYMASSVEMECDAVAAEYAETCPKATGQTAGAVHVIERRQEGKSWVAGVGVRMLPNGQEVKAESGEMGTVHQHLDEHDPGARCSSGYDGGWMDEYEQQDVRRDAVELSVNARARLWPLGAALVARFGPVVSEEQAAGFQRGVKNIYRTGAGIVKHTRLGMLLARAARVVMRTKAALLFVLLVPALLSAAGNPSPTTITLTGFGQGDSIFIPRAWYDTDAFKIGVDANSATPQYHTFLLRLGGYGASAGQPDSVFGYPMTAESQGGPWRLQWDGQTGDTLWFCKLAKAVSDSGAFAFPVPIVDVSARWCKLYLYVAGDTVRQREARFGQIR